jgi:hypothetical protein
MAQPLLAAADQFWRNALQGHGALRVRSVRAFADGLGAFLPPTRLPAHTVVALLCADASQSFIDTNFLYMNDPRPQAQMLPLPAWFADGVPEVFISNKKKTKETKK